MLMKGAASALLVAIAARRLWPRAGSALHWAASSAAPFYVGHSPALMPAREWRYTFERLARVDLAGQTALVTGANSGIGLATARLLARQGAHVLMACCSPDRCARAVAAIRAGQARARVEAIACDTASLASVRAAGGAALARVRWHGGLDMLVLNAGILASAEPESIDGIERVFATNHVGHHLLVRLLQPALERAARRRGCARVVHVTSHAHYHPPAGGVPLSRAALLESRARAPVLHTYGASKLAQVLCAQELARRVRGARACVLVNAVHPGAVSTAIFAQLP